MSGAVVSAARSYEALLVQNATRISSIESTLRSLSYFLPGRFKDAELASEALYTFLNILGVYHDSLLHRTLSTLPPSLRPPPSSHARYTRHFTTSSRPYAHLSRSLQVLSYTSLLIEMTIRKRRGGKAAQNAVVVIEATKAALRLLLLKQTNRRPGVTPPTPEREVDPSVLDMHKPTLVGEPPNARLSFSASAESHWTGDKTGLERTSINGLRGGEFGQGDVPSFLRKRVITVENATRPQDLVRKVKGTGMIAEIVWIFRPLIYVLALKHYGRRHSAPYLLSLALEYLAHTLRKSYNLRMSRDKLNRGESEAEKEETKKRGRAFWWYAVRGPVWESWTRPRLESIIASLEDKPLLGLGAMVVKDYIPLIEDYYYYTA
ncbi:peroxisomal membrane protein pex16 [Meredithblackwellia eburnea MCA 4105]